MTGKIEKFGPVPNRRDGVQIITGHTTQGGVTVQGGEPVDPEAPQEAGYEVRVHEEIMTTNDSIRVSDDPTAPEIRVRTINKGEWEKVKRGDDE